jgi:hypothetical protein
MRNLRRRNYRANIKTNEPDFVADTLESVEAALTDVTSKSSGILEIDVKILIRRFKHRYDLVNLV